MLNITALTRAGARMWLLDFQLEVSQNPVHTTDCLHSGLLS
jgi:hypothetical protein